MSAPTGPVVVGVSPTTGSPAALRWAADYARLHGTALVAVLAWRAPRAPAAPGGRPPGSLMSGDLPDPEGAARIKLDGFVTAALGSTDGIERRVVHGTAVSALLAGAHGAGLLVIGEPRPGRLASCAPAWSAPRSSCGPAARSSCSRARPPERAFRRPGGAR